VYGDFSRVGAGKMPDAKTMGRWGVALGPGVIKGIHDRIVQIALAQKVVQGRKMRIDTTVIESNIHYPTDSSLLGDGVRVLTRSMREITELAGAGSHVTPDSSKTTRRPGNLANTPSQIRLVSAPWNAGACPTYSSAA
jgi:IS5 family transposase